MNRRFFVAALAALWLAGCGSDAPRLGKLGAGDVILAFGDSLTYGTGAKPEESYPALLGQLTGRTVVRAGVPGEQTAGGLARLPGVLDEHQPKLVIVCLGGNDMLRRGAPANIEGNLREILKTIKSRGIDAVLIGVPAPGLITSAPEFYEKLAQEFGIPYEGKIVTSVLYRAELKSDPIHPNAAGYRMMAEAVAGLLRAAGAL
ncbi:MAG: arylesterase [Burkholderiales bacterium]|nr:arylesterase [Burkholderiales bacterium]MDP2399812.1 arylesterase [Burkholderiales bacterium]